jgi:hypothetical protein
MATCTHLDHVHVTRLPESVDGCEECLEANDPWLHLRICLECGHVGCCDSSPNKHATAHADETGHPIIRSLQPARCGRGATSTRCSCGSPRSRARRASRRRRWADERPGRRRLRPGQHRSRALPRSTAGPGRGARAYGAVGHLRDGQAHLPWRGRPLRRDDDGDDARVPGDSGARERRRHRGDRGRRANAARVLRPAPGARRPDRDVSRRHLRALLVLPARADAVVRERRLLWRDAGLRRTAAPLRRAGRSTSSCARTRSSTRCPTRSRRSSPCSWSRSSSRRCSTRPAGHSFVGGEGFRAGDTMVVQGAGPLG